MVEKEKNCQQMDKEYREEEIIAHRNVCEWIVVAERIVQSAVASTRLKSIAAKFLVPAKRYAEIQQVALKGESIEQYDDIARIGFEMISNLEKMNKELESSGIGGILSDLKR